MSKDREYDVVVIGGGVLGTAVALRIAMTSASVCLLEEADDVAEGASKGNAGIVSSYYAPPDTLEASLIAASSPRWEDICGRLDVPFSRPGALTIAVDAKGARELAALCDRAVRAGARAEVLSGDGARHLEPLISPECQGAVHFPDEGLIDPMRLTCAYAELAAANGADIRLDCSAVEFDRMRNRISGVVTPRGTVRAGWVVNAAGAASGRISRLAGGETLDVWPRKGQYWVLDRAVGERLKLIVLPVPSGQTRGIQVVPTTNGSILLGPDAKDGIDPEDKETDHASLVAILEEAKRLVPSVTVESAIKTYAANRAACDETVRVRHDVSIKNLVHVGNRSTGVSASPATADLVLEILKEAGLTANERGDSCRQLPKVRKLVSDPEPESLPSVDSRYAQVICVCEQVTAAEISEALTRRVSARSIEGVRKRTRATAGRCQGAVCMAGVAFLCSLHTGETPANVRYGAGRGTLGVGSVA